MCCVLVAGALTRAEGQQPAPPAFKGGVSLVTVDVTVLDRDGKPVPGLTSNDFQVKLNGKAQPVRALTYLEARTAAPESAPDPKAPPMPQMFPVAEVRGGDASTTTESRVFVILVDDLSFPPLGGKALFTAAQRFVAGLPAGDLVGFATSSGPGGGQPDARSRAHRRSARGGRRRIHATLGRSIAARRRAKRPAPISRSGSVSRWTSTAAIMPRFSRRS